MKLKQLIKKIKCKIFFCIGSRCSLNEGTPPDNNKTTAEIIENAFDDVIEEIEDGIENIITNIEDIDIYETPKTYKVKDWIEEVEGDVQDE